MYRKERIYRVTRRLSIVIYGANESRMTASATANNEMMRLRVCHAMGAHSSQNSVVCPYRGYHDRQRRKIDYTQAYKSRPCYKRWPRLSRAVRADVITRNEHNSRSLRDLKYMVKSRPEGSLTDTRQTCPGRNRVPMIHAFTSTAAMGVDIYEARISQYLKSSG